jgi:hypothetical protein
VPKLREAFLHTHHEPIPRVERAMEPFVNTAAVAAHVGMSPRTVAKWAREGRIPAHPLCGNARRTWGFKLSEVDSFLASRMSSGIVAARPGCSAERE